MSTKKLGIKSLDRLEELGCINKKTRDDLEYALECGIGILFTGDNPRSFVKSILSTVGDNKIVCIIDSRNYLEGVEVANLANNKILKMKPGEAVIPNGSVTILGYVDSVTELSSEVLERDFIVFTLKRVNGIRKIISVKEYLV